MFNPLLDNMDQLTDSEVDTKINELSKKYWQTQNYKVKEQIAVIYDMYRLEAQSRRARAYQQQKDDNDNDLDGLININ